MMVRRLPAPRRLDMVPESARDVMATMVRADERLMMRGGTPSVTAEAELPQRVLGQRNPIAAAMTSAKPTSLMH